MADTILNETVDEAPNTTQNEAENPLRRFNRRSLRDFVKRVSNKRSRGKQVHITDRSAIYSEIQRISTERAKAKK